MIKKIIVVGGGTSGLVTAMLLKNSYPKIKINVVESSGIDIIGVGEGTTEHWKEFVNRLKLPQDELFLETDATIKVGTKFVNWNNDGKSYWHSILNEYSSCYVNRLPNHYAYVVANNIDPVGMVHEYLDRSIFTPNFVAHQCHFDTFKLNTYLHKKASQQGIIFINAKINAVNLSNDGCIDSLVDDSGNILSADFFIDASGFNRVIMKHLDTKWIDYSKHLPVNRAIAFQTPGVENINSFTTSTSMKNGWMWNAPTQKRYGNGYVFRDDYTTVDNAISEVETMLGHSINVAKDIKFGAGKLDSFMKKNCVAVGLSAMFVEPLEASSISSSIQQAFCLVNMLTAYSRDNTIVEKRYNELFDKVFDNIIDFIQIHYITKRDDTAFWKEKPFELTEFNKETLPVFKHSMPTFNFFENSFTLYRENNWIMVLHGLGFFNTDSIKRLWESQPNWLQEGVAKDYHDRKSINQNLGISMLSHRDVINLVLTGNKNII